MTNLLVPDALDVDLAGPLAHFAEHGWARIGRVMSEDGIAALRARCDDLMLGRVTYPGLFFQADSPTGSYDDLEFGKGYVGPRLDYRKIERLELDPLFLSWIENPLFERIATAVVGPEVTLYRAVLMTKAVSGGTVLPFHQDGGRFWGIDRDPVLQVWTAFDDAPVEAGCVEVVPGSHRGGLTTENGGGVPDELLARERADDRAVPLPARAGEVFLIHNHVWHRSGLNRSGHPRRALSICFLDGATRCTRKKRAPRVFRRLFA